ncbi:protein phosphatase 1 regulatory subunit 36 isoform X2 [Anguilla rostrata]|uniref:protein phosphatase 1 regulatory subunit 36 isoform X2 n=1 Tax=Anguilla anguilla TaxID=7936 RepID=UPI0015AEE2AA|nr:protein phosphatase 1 regulatory subunit 36 isoform X2 [Anguilla anguilla]
MSKPQMEMSCDLIPSHGVWGWNDEHQSLEFISLDTPAEAKERKKRCKLLSSQDTVSKRPERSAVSAVSGKGQPRARSPTDKSAVGEAQLNAYKSSPKRDQRDCVTIEDIKQATLILLQEKESVPLGFLPILKQRELDDFLASLLLYLSCFFVKTTLEKKTTPHMMEQSLREQQEMAEACMKVDLSLKQLAIHYSTLLLELTLPLLSAGKGKTSAKHKEVFECLYRFLCYAAWVTFERKDLSAIQEEVGRLLYSDTFNPACKLRAKQGVSSQDRAQKAGEVESKDPAGPPVPKSRNCPRRLDLTKVLTQRTPLMEALLPPTGQAAPHLFSAFSPQKERSLIVCDREVLLDQLTDQLASLSFGILGKPLSLFSGPTLIRRGEENKDEEEEKGENANRSSASADVHSKQGRTNTAVSRATTEGGYSDTE